MSPADSSAKKADSATLSKDVDVDLEKNQGSPARDATSQNSGTGHGGGNASSTSVEFEPPLACIRRILKQSLPKSTNVGKDASLAFSRACGIFCIYLTTCANDFAKENKRTTITASDILAAIKELDFDEFVPQLEAFLAEHRADEKRKKEAKAQAMEAVSTEKTPADIRLGSGEPEAKRMKTLSATPKASVHEDSTSSNYHQEGKHGDIEDDGDDKGTASGSDNDEDIMDSDNEE